MAVKFTLFGSFHVGIGDGTVLRDRDFGGRKPKQLLEILLLQEGRYLAKEQLADALWGDALPTNFMSTIEHYVSVVRKRLQPGGRIQSSLLVTGHGGYRVDVERAEVDIMAFDRVLDSVRPDLAQIEAGLALVTGELLEDEPYSEWALKARTYYGQRHQRLLMLGADTALRTRHHARAEELAELSLRIDPLHEEAYRVRMTAQYLAGNQRDALATFRTCHRVLADEAGLSPMSETIALHQAIVDQTPPEVLLPTGDRRKGGQLATATVAAGLAPAPQSAAPAPPPVRAAQHLAGSAPLAPLIGRGPELTRLVAACTPGTSAPAGGPMSVLLVDGEAGVGKSRLLDELSARLQGTRVIRLECTPLEATLRGALLTDLVRAVAGPPAARQLVDDALAAPDWSGSGPQPSVVLGLSRLLRGSEPFVAIIDEAQWADADSVAMLTSAARRSAPEGGGALVFAYRTEALTPRHPLAQVTPATRLTLRPLTQADLAPYGGPALHSRTGGLPRYLVDGLTGPGEPFGPGTELAVSAALRSAVLSQARGDGDEMFRTAAIAAWVPQPYGPEEIARLVGRDPLRVADQLERLQEMGLTEVRGVGFAFRYEVVRQILGETVSPARRRLLAGRVRMPAALHDRRATTAVRPPARDRRSSLPDRRGAGVPTVAPVVASLVWPDAESA